MAKQGRFFRPKPAALKGTKYDSMTEKRLHEGALKTCKFHTTKVDYIISHKYEPDFILEHGKRVVYIEVKGYFQEASELQKYSNIGKCLEVNETLVFVFEKPDLKIHFKAKRKDGSKMTHAEWADKNKFKWYSEQNAHLILEDFK